MQLEYVMLENFQKRNLFFINRIRMENISLKHLKGFLLGTLQK